jgi:Tfp pilus assembly protein PilN
MTDFKHIIEPERMGLWTAAAFILALLALVVALVGTYRTNGYLAATQIEMLMLNKKIEAASQQAAAAPAPVAEVAPAPVEETAPAMPEQAE